MDLPVGSMGPKVQAACDFARNTGNDAVIGALTDITKIIDGTAGTRVRSVGAPGKGSSSSRIRRTAGKC
jgi:carbamate kinase